MNINPEGILNVKLDLTDSAGTAGESIDMTQADSGISTGVIGNTNLSGFSRIGIEHNYYLLDGTMGETADVPWASTNVTDSGWYVGTTLQVTTSTSAKPVSRVTVVFDPVAGEHASGIGVYVYDTDGNLVHSGSYFNRETVMEIPLGGSYVVGEVTLDIVEWSTFPHRPMVSAVILGEVFEFSKNDILSFSMDFTGEPLATTIPTASASFEIPNFDHAWSILYPNNYMDDVTKDAFMEVTFGYEGYPTLINKFYLTEWSSVDGASATFTGESILTELGQAAPAFTGTYNFQDIITGCLNAIPYLATSTSADWYDLSPDLFVIDFAEANRSVTFDDDLDVADMTNADVIQLIGSASTTSDTPCSLVIARTGVVGIVRISKGGDGYPYTYNGSKHFYLDRDNQVAYPEGSYRPKLYAVVVNDDYTTEPYNPAWSSPDGETQTTANDFVTGAYMSRYGMLIGDWLSTRKEITCEFRPDPTVNDLGYQQVDLTVRPLDMVDIQIGDENPYYVGTMQVTEVNLSFDGAWHGTLYGILREKVV